MSEIRSKHSVWMVCAGAAVLALLASPGCDNAASKVANGLVTCAADTDCPAEYHCASDKTCWENGQDPASDASVPEVGPVDPGDGALVCPAGLVQCAGSCIDPKTSRSYCGATGDCKMDAGTGGVACKSGEVCSEGKCSLSCAGGLVNCAGSCVDPQTSRSHCGATTGCGVEGGTPGTVCASGEVCAAGTCALSCPQGLINCNGTCVDGKTNRSFCGATEGCGIEAGSAGNVCGSGQVCNIGVCSVSCPQGQVVCNGACVDPQTSRAYCGATTGCGVTGGSAGAVCGAGQVCNTGACALSCPPGQVICGGTCVDPQSNGTYCGATTGCGVTGGSAGAVCGAGQVCNTGACALSCPAGQVICGGTCVDPQTSRSNCGATNGCGVTGGIAGAVCGTGQVCGGGACSLSCPPGQVICGGTCVDPQSSRSYCGATSGCGVTGGSAGSVCGAGQVCGAGTCALSCPSGQVECGGTCVDPQTSRSYCGASSGCGVTGGTAGMVCGTGQVCGAGTCSLSCPPGQLVCGGTCVDPQTSRSYCGATSGCGVTGGSAGTSCGGGQVCGAGTCSLSCPPGQVVCGGTCVDPQSNRSYCGATNGCGVTGGTAGAACGTGQVCGAGTCSLSCPPGQVVCGGTCVDPQSSRSYCGATSGCGVTGGSAGAACGTGQVCSSGTCALSCPPGQVICSGNCVDPQSNRSYCGATTGCGVTGGSAGTSCGAGQVCGAGVCALSCPPGQIICGGSCVDPSFNPTYCGATAGCGVTGGTPGTTCGATSACLSGTCFALAVPNPTFLWLDASDLSTITKDGANNVTQWRDKSGLARHANVSGTSPVYTAGVTPNGGAGILFNGSAVRLQTANVTTVSDMSIFVVFNMVAPQTWGSIINQNHDQYFSIRKSDCCGGNGNLNFHIQNNNAAPLQPITLNAWRLLTTMRQNTLSTMYYRGGATTLFNGDTLIAGGSAPISIGNAVISGQSMGGYISEIRAFSSALTATQRALVEADLAAKYGL